MANFLDAPTRGDGTSGKLTKQNFNKPPHFHDPTIEELRNHLEEYGTEESTRDSFLVKSNEVVRTPAKLELYFEGLARDYLLKNTKMVHNFVG